MIGRGLKDGGGSAGKGLAPVRYLGPRRRSRDGDRLQLMVEGWQRDVGQTGGKHLSGHETHGELGGFTSMLYKLALDQSLAFSGHGWLGIIRRDWPAISARYEWKKKKLRRRSRHL
jgi:hypothetical protein